MYTIDVEYRGANIRYEGDAPPDLKSMCRAIDLMLDEAGPRADRDASQTPDKPANSGAGKGVRKGPKKVETAEKPKEDEKPDVEPPAAIEHEKPTEDEKPEQPEGGEKPDEKPDDAPEITTEALRDQVMAYAKEKGNPQAKRLVQEVGGADKVSAVSDDKRLELYKAAGGEV